ncbi:MAG: J domain-containing protein [Pirellulales bacterium]
MSATPHTSANDLERPHYMATLGLLPPYMPEDIEKAYLARVKEIRPDLGGDPKPFYELQTAYMQAKEYVRFRGDRRGWIAKRMDEYLATQEVSEELKAFGAEVETNFVDWLQKSFGEFAELTESILAIRLHNSPRGDEFIELLLRKHDQLLSLERLDIEGCTVSDSSVHHLNVFRRLRELNLNRTPITWQALHIVQWLPELHAVNVDGTKLNWFTRWRLASQLKKKRQAAESSRAVHPLTVR